MTRIDELFDNKLEMISCIAAHRISKVNKIIGSAVYIAPGIFLTAKHVADEWQQDSVDGDRFARLEDIPESKLAGFDVDILQNLKYKSLAVWRIHKVHTLIDSDVTVLISLGSDDIYVRRVADLDDKFIINLHPPTIGEEINIAGYPHSTNQLIEGSKSNHVVRLTQNTGVVQDYFLNGNGMVKGACVHTSANIIGGMSGGPAFNSAGELFGINSSEYEFEQDDNDHVSFVSLLWSAFAQKIYTPQLGETNLYEMAKEGYLAVKGLEHFSVDNGVFNWLNEVNSCAQCNEDSAAT